MKVDEAMFREFSNYILIKQNVASTILILITSEMNTILLLASGNGVYLHTFRSLLRENGCFDTFY